jgi:hypothetical protein
MREGEVTDGGVEKASSGVEGDWKVRQGFDLALGVVFVS